MYNGNFRQWHYLLPNARSKTPTNFAFIATSFREQYARHSKDRQSYILEHWCSIATRLDRDCWTRREKATGDYAVGFWNFIYGRLDKKRPLWLWGHCISQSMQLLYLGQEIEAGHLEWQTVEYGLSANKDRQEKVTWQGVVVLEDPPTVIELRHPHSGCKLWILDTLNFWRCTHEEFCKTFRNTNDSKETEIFQTLPPENDSSVSCRAVEKAITSLVSTIRTRDLGNMRWTGSAQGLQCYRHRFMRHKILVHCDETALQLERESYFGGNCTIYQLGVVKGPIYVVDYQSFYPSIMATRYLPYRYLGSCIDQVRCSSLSWLSDAWRIARVTLNSPRLTFPVRYRGHLCMVKGRFVTTLQEPELAVALDTGCIERIHAISWYARGVLFDKFVSELWRYRSEAKSAGNDVEADFYKLLLNGVPGKLGQKQIDWIDEPKRHAAFAWGQHTVLDADSGEIAYLRYLNWRVQRKRLRGESVPAPYNGVVDPTDGKDYDVHRGPALNDESSQSVPQIAGAITSLGRVLLQETIDYVGVENVFYADTDCLHVNQCGLDRLNAGGKISPDTLGKLAIKTVAAEAEYRGIKYYRLNDVWTVAGKKPDSTPIVDGRWEQSEYSGWSSLLYDGTCGSVQEVIVPCERNDEFIPGNVLSNGRVEPICLVP